MSKIVRIILAVNDVGSVVDLASTQARTTATFPVHHGSRRNLRRAQGSVTNDDHAGEPHKYDR